MAACYQRFSLSQLLKLVVLVAVVGSALSESSTANATTDSSSPSIKSHTGEEWHSLMARLLGWCIFGIFVLMALVFYLVNMNDPQVKRTTWMAISNTLSLLCAILLYDSLMSFLVVLVDQIIGTDTAVADASFFVHSTVPTCAAPSHSSSTTDSHSSTATSSTGSAGHRRLSTGGVSNTDITVAFFLFGAVFLITEFGFFWFRSRKFALGAWAAINAHVVGFAALGFFGTVQQVSPFCEDWGATLTPILMAWAFMGMLLLLSSFMRHCYAKKAEWESEAEMEEFEEICAESEDDSLAFCLGFLISVALRFAISGVMPSLHDVPIGKTAGEVFGLGTVGFLSIVAVIIFGLVPTPEMRVLKRAYHSFTACLTMTAGWCAVYFSQWLFWWATDGYGVLGEGNMLSAALVLVFFCTLYAIGMTLLCDYIGDNYAQLRKAMDLVLVSFVLLTGLSWESAFLSAASAIDPSVSNALGKAALDLLEVVCFCSVIIPAWIWYILPHALEQQEEEDAAEGDAKEGGQKDLELGEGSNEAHLLYHDDDDPNVPIIHAEVSPHAHAVGDHHEIAQVQGEVIRSMSQSQIHPSQDKATRTREVVVAVEDEPEESPLPTYGAAPYDNDDDYDGYALPAAKSAAGASALSHQQQPSGPSVVGHAEQTRQRQLEEQQWLSEARDSINSQNIPVHFAPKRGRGKRKPPPGPGPGAIGSSRAQPPTVSTAATSDHALTIYGVAASPVGRKIDYDEDHGSHSQFSGMEESHMDGPIKVRKKRRKPPAGAGPAPP
eukprot:CAMPEP_0178435986 /NCGR_PEP_ID=MMETSP0689_2-20121128/34208_1 /TAXON_ID=160604 /ORGANISM="Amphidinium massartii, Strain CS-259" /LENGTH=776 /DNA_ID=CAMNT_0020058071 /DNA_START=36 /DNA_END=2363 /DNA_ORIENTATION=-